KATAAILWAFVIVAAYFWAHKPFNAQIVRGVGESVLSILLWLALTALGAALGRRLLQALPGHPLADEAPAIRLALSAGAGLGFISIVVWALGMVGLFRPSAAWGAVLLLAFLLRHDLRALVELARRLRLPRPGNRLQRWFLFYAVLSLTMTFLVALAPPIAWDSLVYHLNGPRLYIESGQIGHPIDLPYLGFPQLGQMQFGLAMLLLGDRVPALFHFGYALMALAVTVALTRRAFGRSAAWFAGAILLSVPTFFSLASWPYVDLTLLFFATAAFYAFFRWRERHDVGEVGSGWLILAGLMVGFAGGVKYTAVIIPFALAASIAWSSRRDGLGAIVRRLLLVGVPALLVVLPWPLENWLTTGNPVYPFFFDDARFWDAWRGWWYDRPGTGLAATAPWRLLIVPLEATVLGTQGKELYEATLGPLLLISVGLLALVWRALTRAERAAAGHMILFLALNYLLWLNGVARTAMLLRARFLFPVFGIVAALGGVALARLPSISRPQLDVGWLVRVVVIMSLALLLFATAVDFILINPLPVLVGLESEEQYVERRLGPYPNVMEAINTLPPDARVIFLWEPRSYGCIVDCWPDALLDRFLHHTQHLDHDAEEIAAAWREMGFTHVLLRHGRLRFIIEADFDPVTEADLQILESLISRHLEPVAQWSDDYTLYALEE
ncbi:MAG: glycosyltransferase family 39 protein, partial [Candidatus Promineifilaceae bacterium]|nr:glycosyltransferase family 39 protein [Candidatus Promineifilaceae bacterium]